MRSRRLVSTTSPPLHGTATVPGDKSISHRVALLGAMAEGATEGRDFLLADDCLRSLAAAKALGCRVTRSGADVFIESDGVEAWTQPDEPLDLGNSGTSMRLLAGALAGRPLEVTLDGDESLRQRPMDRIAEPLEQMGASLTGQGSRRCPPITVRGGPLRPIAYEQPIASAQVKSAILLAALQATGDTIVHQPSASRDHTERLIAAFGGQATVEGLDVRLTGPQQLHGASITIPGDFSSASFLIAAAALVRGSDVHVEAVGLNQTRTGFLSILTAMGARLRIGPILYTGQEPWGSVAIYASDLRAVPVGGDVIPACLDELPLVAVLATQAEGETVVADAAELRVKESDRITAMAEGLGAMGADIRATDDGWIVRGPTPLRGVHLKTYMDHRLAMALAVAGLIAEGETVLEGAESIATSFPTFANVLASLGARVRLI